MEQIERDVVRTHPDIPFFNGEHENTPQHREDLKRALLIFAKLNPGIKYVQGFNELLAPLYYIFKTDPDPSMSVRTYPSPTHAFVNLPFSVVRVLGFQAQGEKTGTGLWGVVCTLSVTSTGGAHVVKLDGLVISTIFTAASTEFGELPAGDRGLVVRPWGYQLRGLGFDP
eukprot:2421829-Pyramimonas_sp.AAC.1